MLCPTTRGGLRRCPAFRCGLGLGRWLGVALLLLGSVSAQAESRAAWVDPLPELEAAVAAADAEHGRRSEAYMTAVGALVQAHLGRGEFEPAAALFADMLGILQDTVPADDPGLLQLRTVAAQLREQATACGPGVAADADESSDPLGFRLVAQSAAYDPHLNALSSDGRWLASGAGHALVLRDVDSGLVVRQIRDTPSTIKQLAFVPHSNHLVAAFDNSCLAVWDVTTGRRTAVAAAPLATQLLDVAVSPDGTLIAAAYAGAVNDQALQQLSVWNFADGAIERRFFLDDKFHFLQYADVFGRLRFSHNGRTLLSYSFLNTRLWNMHDGSLVNAVPSAEWLKQAGAGDDAMLKEVAPSPDGKYLALRSDEAIWLLRTEDDFRPARRIDLPPGEVLAQDTTWFSPDGSRMLVGSELLYAVETGERLPLPDSGISWAGWIDGRRLLLDGFGGYAVWDGEQQPLHRASRGAPGTLQTVAFANQGTALVTDAGGQSYWDLHSLYLQDERPAAVSFDQPVQGGLVRYLVPMYGDMERAAASLAGERLLGVYVDRSEHLYTGHADGRVRSWAVADGSELSAHAAQPAAVTALAVSADERFLATASGGKPLMDFSDTAVPPATLTVRDLQSGSELWRSRGHPGSVSSLVVSPDGRYLVSMSPYRIAVHRLATGELLREVNHQPLEGMFSAVAVNAREQLAFVAAFGSTRRDTRVVVLDLTSGEQLKSYRNDSDLGSVALSPGGELLAATQQDGVVRLWSLQTDRSVALAESFVRRPAEEETLETLFNPPREWVAYTPDGYFAAARGGTGLVAVVRGMEGYNLDQFGLRFNRPDILLERLQLGHPGIVEHFRQRHVARLRQAGLAEVEDVAGIAVPHAEVVTAELAGQGAALQMQLAFRSSDVDLLSYNVYVNGVPVYPGKGTALSGRQGNAAVTVPLSSGDNLVEVSALAANGMESPRAPVRFVGAPASRKPALYFLGFGVSNYADASLNLGYAHKDVQDLAAALGASEQFGAVHVHAFTDAQVTPSAIADAKRLLTSAAIDDVVVVLVAGHGMHDRDAAGTYYYLTHAADPARLADTAADFSLLESLLVDIRARNRLFLLDTCESGELEPAFVAGVFDALQGQQERARTARGLTLEAPAVQAAAPERRPYLQQRSRYIYNDLSRRNGVVMFASSAGHELSYESAEKQNGYFTEALLQVLGQSGRKSLEVLREQVRKLVIQYSDGKQHPGVYWNNLHSQLYFDPIRELP